MLQIRFCLLLFFTIGLSYAQKEYDYVLAPQDSITDIYFNVTIKDPYQWMEDVTDVRMADWLDYQTKLIRKTKNKLSIMPLRDQMGTMFHGVREKDIKTNLADDKTEKSKYEFDFKHQNFNRSPNLLYRLRGAKNYKRLVDTRKFVSDKDDNINIYGRYINEEEDLAAIAISLNGSDWLELFFFDLKSGEQLEHTLKDLRKGSAVILDGKNMFYDGFDAPEQGRESLDKAKGQKLFFHQFETEQSQDKLLYENPDVTGTNRFNFRKIDDKFFFDNPYLHKGEVYRTLSVASVDSLNLDIKDFMIYPNDKKIELKIEEVFGDKVLLKTNWDAPNGRVLLSDLNNPNSPSEIIPEYDVQLKYVNRLGKDKFVCVYRNENKELALIFDLQGKLLNKIEFPEGKKVNYLYENDEDAEFTDFCISSFYHPDLWYQLSLKDLSFKPTVALSVPYDPEALETRYVKYTSKDGTQIPMYITCLKDIELDGSNPTLLYGYGGYGITVEPSYDESKALWLLKGGVLAVPNVRGGGAEGLDWGLQGRRLNKQNAIDDFIAAAEYLTNENYTNSEKLGVNGGSHGALLVTAAAVQRPELFKAIVAEAGPYDMLRFNNFTVGSVATNINEFGTVSKIEDFKNLKSYSPLHNIKKDEKFPDLLLITGESDDRVPPFHSYKFLATLQAKASSESLYLLYVIPGAGHGGALTANDYVDKFLYKYGFLYYELF